MRIIGIGDNVVDCYLDQGLYYPGGNCVNVAVNAKRAGAKKADYLGIFATDDKAQHIKRSLDKEGISYEYSREVKGVSGQPKVNLTPDGDRIFVGGPKNTVQHCIKLKLTEDDLSYLRDFDLAHSSCYSSFEEELPVLSSVIPVSFDFSDRHDEAYLKKVCPFIDYGFFSGSDLTDEELETLIELLSPYDLKVVGITRGAKPAVFLSSGRRYFRSPLETEVVDTMGAGDSFIGAFLVGYLDGLSMEEALEKGAESARHTCTFYGGFGYPEELEG